VDSSVKELEVHDTLLEVIEVFRVGQSGEGKEGSTKGEDISLVLVGSELEVLSGDLLEEFRGHKALDTEEEVLDSTISALLAVESGVAELVGFIGDEDGGRRDLTVIDALLLELSKDGDHILGKELEFNFRDKVARLDVLLEFGLHGLVEGVEIEVDGVGLRAAEGVFFRGVADDVDKAGMWLVDSTIVVGKLSLVGIGILGEDLLAVHLLTSLGVSDELDITKLAGLVLVDDFNLRGEGLLGGFLLLGGGGTHDV
jgi:hypothetical protein